MCAGGGCLSLSLQGLSQEAVGQLMGQRLTILDPLFVPVDIEWEGKASGWGALGAHRRNARTCTACSALWCSLTDRSAAVPSHHCAQNSPSQAFAFPAVRVEELACVLVDGMPLAARAPLPLCGAEGLSPTGPKGAVGKGAAAGKRSAAAVAAGGQRSSDR